MLIAKQENLGISFEPIPEGVHVARCNGIIDLGTQYSEKFDKTAHKVQIMWELTEETFTNDKGQVKNKAISKEYTLSLHEKSSLTKTLESWRGKKFTEEELKGFDLTKVLGKGCQLQIIHTVKGESTYSNIAAIMALPKGMKLDPPEEVVVFDLDSPECTAEIAVLPEWIQNKIKESKEWKGINLTEHHTKIAEEEPNF